MRRLLVVVGVASAVGGVVLIARPGLATFGERSLLVGLGVLALVQGGRVALDRRGASQDVAETPDPETEQDLPVPGDDLDEALSAVRRRTATVSRGAKRSRRQRRATVRERIETAALDTIVRQYGCTRERARRALETGEWTDDPDAAAFFTGDLDGVGPRGRLRRMLASEPPFSRRARHAADAVARLADADRVEPLSPGSVDGAVEPVTDGERRGPR